jgi:hypothetical protein
MWDRSFSKGPVRVRVKKWIQKVRVRGRVRVPLLKSPGSGPRTRTRTRTGGNTVFNHRYDVKTMFSWVSGKRNPGKKSFVNGKSHPWLSAGGFLPFFSHFFHILSPLFRKCFFMYRFSYGLTILLENRNKNHRAMTSFWLQIKTEFP